MSGEDFKRMPTEGVLTCAYMCAPELRNYKFRKQVVESFAGPEDVRAIRFSATLSGMLFVHGLLQLF